MSPTWHNHTGNQRCEPRGIERPSSLEELVALVRRAEAEGTTVRAVGAGHAWSCATSPPTKISTKVTSTSTSSSSVQPRS